MTNQNDKQLLYDLFVAYYDTRRNKRQTINALQFEIEYESNLFQLYEEIRDREYQISRSICFINCKPVQREIFAADFRDRVIHHLLYNYLQPVFEPSFIKDSYSCQVGKGTHFGIRRVESFMRKCSHNYTKDAWVLKLDILGYFMQIDRKILYSLIRKKLDAYHAKHQCWWYDLAIYLLKLVIFNDPTQNCIIRGSAEDWQGLPKSKSLFQATPGKGFPIGNLTSQFFSNIYLNAFDHYVKENLEVQFYGRYVDDMVFIHPDNSYLKFLISKIEIYLWHHLELQIHPRKHYLQHYTKGLPFLGVYIKPYRNYIGKRTKNNFYQAIQNWNEHLIAKSGKLNEADVKLLVSTVNSYLGSLQHCNTYYLRKKWLFLLRPEFYNYVYISGGYRKLVPKKRKMKKRHGQFY